MCWALLCVCYPWNRNPQGSPWILQLFIYSSCTLSLFTISLPFRFGRFFHKIKGVDRPSFPSLLTLSLPHFILWASHGLPCCHRCWCWHSSGNSFPSKHQNLNGAFKPRPAAVHQHPHLLTPTLPSHPAIFWLCHLFSHFAFWASWKHKE